ncbi:MAG: hypothetical protein ACOH1N_08085 [Lutibacter sp.]
MNYFNYLFFFFFFFFFIHLSTTYAQTKFSREDLNGQWQSTKPGADLILDIDNSQATILSLGKSTLTKSLIGGNMYESISYNGNGVWKAQRNSWIYNGVGGNNSDKGHWEKGPELTLKLSEDKNTLSASGHWSYKRVNAVIENTSNVTSTLLEDFGGVKAKFILGSLSNKNIIVTQFTNVTNTKMAKIEITLDNGPIINETIEPGITLTKKYDAKKIIIQIKYEKSDKPKPTKGIIDVVKERVGKEVRNENGVLRIYTLTGVGVRG